MAKLNEVFGIVTAVPTLTYVDRAKLDERFGDLLQQDKHIIIYGASKQGKTTLRKKCLPDAGVVIVRCRRQWSRDDLYGEILGALGISKETVGDLLRSADERGAHGGGKAGPPGLFSIFFGGSRRHAEERARETIREPIDADQRSLRFVTQQLIHSGKRLVIEDFQYLPKDMRKDLAVDLKLLWDSGVYAIVVGIWAEQNTLATFNPHLLGRFAEIDVEWTDDELAQVIEKGELALNITLADVIKNQIIRDATGNVGLLQQLLQGYCARCGIRETQQDHQTLSDRQVLSEVRQAICAPYTVRYRSFSLAMTDGPTAPEIAELKVPQRFLRVCVEATDEELINGLPETTALERVSAAEPRIRQSDVTMILAQLEELQDAHDISPVVLSYNPETRTVQLVDREFLFFRRYGPFIWPWDGTTVR